MVRVLLSYPGKHDTYQVTLINENALGLRSRKKEVSVCQNVLLVDWITSCELPKPTYLYSTAKPRNRKCCFGDNKSTQQCDIACLISLSGVQHSAQVFIFHTRTRYTTRSANTHVRLHTVVMRLVNNNKCGHDTREIELVCGLPCACASLTGCPETCQATQNVICQGCWAEFSIQTININKTYPYRY